MRGKDMVRSPWGCWRQARTRRGVRSCQNRRQGRRRPGEEGDGLDAAPSIAPTCAEKKMEREGSPELVDAPTIIDGMGRRPIRRLTGGRGKAISSHGGDGGGDEEGELARV